MPSTTLTAPGSDFLGEFRRTVDEVVDTADKIGGAIGSAIDTFDRVKSAFDDAPGSTADSPLSDSSKSQSSPSPQGKGVAVIAGLLLLVWLLK